MLSLFAAYRECASEVPLDARPPHYEPSACRHCEYAAALMVRSHFLRRFFFFAAGMQPYE